MTSEKSPGLSISYYNQVLKNKYLGNTCDESERGLQSSGQETTTELPSPAEFVDKMRTRRQSLIEELEEINKTPGFRLSETERCWKRESVEKELAQIEKEWHQLGGDDIEEKEAKRAALIKMRELPGFKYPGGGLRKGREADKLKEDIAEAGRSIDAAKADLFANAFPAPKPTEEDLKSEGKRLARERVEKYQQSDDPKTAEYGNFLARAMGLEAKTATTQREAVADNEKKDEADEEKPASPEERLESVRKEYAEARVAVESNFFKKFFGGKGREQRLKDLAEQVKGFELAVAKLKLESEIKKLDSLEAGSDEYNQQQEELAQRMAAYAFDGLQETEKLTADAYDKMLEDRSKFSKLAAKAGRWFTKGGKLSQFFRTGGVGVVAGTTTALVATWPITTAVGLAGGIVIGGAVKQKALEDNLGEDRVNTSQSYQEAWSRTLLEAAKDQDDTSAQMKAMIGATADGMNENSKERQEVLRKQVRGAMGKFALGFAAGVGAANFLQSTVFGAENAPDAIVPEEGGVDSPASDGGVSDGRATAGAELSSHADSVDLTNTESFSFDEGEYPWNWAENLVGSDNAMSYLEELGAKAAEAGHDVVWRTLPNGARVLIVDGSDKTADVVGVLSQFR